MDLSSPGLKAGSETTTQPDLEAASATIADAKCDVENESYGNYSDKSLRGIRHDGQGHSITNVVRLRLECITDGQMKVMLCKQYTASDGSATHNTARLSSIIPPETGKMAGC